MDPFAEFACSDGKIVRTKALQDQSKNPKWNERLFIKGWNGEDVRLTVYDEDCDATEMVGSCMISDFDGDKYHLEFNGGHCGVVTCIFRVIEEDVMAQEKKLAMKQLRRQELARQRTCQERQREKRKKDFRVIKTMGGHSSRSDCSETLSSFGERSFTSCDVA